MKNKNKTCFVLDDTGTYKPRTSNEIVIIKKTWLDKLRDKIPLFSFNKLKRNKR